MRRASSAASVSSGSAVWLRSAVITSCPARGGQAPCTGGQCGGRAPGAAP